MTGLKMLLWVYEKGEIEQAELDVLEQAFGTHFHILCTFGGANVVQKHTVFKITLMKEVKGD
jgi:hypothetical protein